MIPYIGDFAEDETIYHYFNTFDSNDPSASVTITNLASTDLYVHKDGVDSTETTTGATIDVDFDTQTGIHKVTVDTSADAFYATGSDYMVRMEGTTVDGATINAALFTFSIQNRYSAGALRPTTAGRTLDVSATGEAGLDWANIGSPTTAQNLSGTNIDVDQVVASVSGNVDGSVASVTAGVTLAAGAITDASLAGNMESVFETNFATAWNATRGAWQTNVQDFVGTSAADPFNGQVVAASVTGAVASVSGNVDGNVTGSVGSNLELGPTEVNAQCDAALSDIGLDHLIQSALPTNWATDVASGSVFDNIADDGTAVYDRTTDSLQAVRDHVGDGTNLTEAGGTGDHLTAIDLPNQTMDITGNLSGSVGSVTGNVDGNVTGSVGSNLELGPAEVNSEVSDVLKTDTMTQSTLCPQEAPPVNPTFEEAVAYLYKAWRNKSVQNATTYELYDNAGTTVDQKATVSDDATDATKGLVGTGP